MCKILSNILLSRLTPYGEEIIGTISMDFDATCQLLIIRYILHFSNSWEKKWKYNAPVHQLFIDFKNAYDSIGREVLYNILIEFGIPRKLVMLIKMCLNEIYSTVWVCKHVIVMFYVKNSRNKEMLYCHCFLTLFLVYDIKEDSSKPGYLEIKWYTSAFGLCWWC